MTIRRNTKILTAQGNATAIALIEGADGVFVWTYSDFNGQVTSANGSAALIAIGGAFNTTVSAAEDAFVMSAGNFGTGSSITAANGDAGAITLGGQSGSVSAPNGSVVLLGESTINVGATAGEDLVVWSIGSVQGSYSAGGDAAAISHGSFNASLLAGGDIVAVYGRDGVSGSISADRNIDEVFSHAGIMANLLAGDASVSDPKIGHVREVIAWGSIDQAITATESIDLVRAGGDIDASLNAPVIGSVIENDPTVETDFPLPDVPESIRDEILAELAATLAELEADRADAETEIEDASAAFATSRQETADAINEARGETTAAVGQARTKANEELAEKRAEISESVDDRRESAELRLALTELGIQKDYATLLAKQQEALEDVTEALAESQRAVHEAESALQLADDDMQQSASAAVVNARTEYVRRTNDYNALKDAYEYTWNEMLEDAWSSAVAGIYFITSEENLDRIQLALDVAGLAPVFGIFADGANTAISLARGRWSDAAINGLSMIPVLGQKVKGAQLAARTAKAALKHGDNAVKLAREGIQHADEIVDFLKTQCFARDTLVSTETGLRPIGEIRSGERVHSFDFETGEWKLQPVLDRIDSYYSGNVLTIETDDTSIECTEGHPFWVVDGENLASRPTPKELADDEDQNRSLEGRWVNSDDLRTGDTLVGKDGSHYVVGRITQRDETAFPVSNLTVRELHNYAVGRRSLLVHNTNELCEKAIATLQDMLRDPDVGIDYIEVLVRETGATNADEVMGLLRKTLNGIDLHHGTPKEVLKKVEGLYGIDPKSVRGKTGQRNLIPIDRKLHQLAHAGKLRGLPRYNPEFLRRLQEIEDANGFVTAQDVWRVRAQMLNIYFNIPL